MNVRYPLVARRARHRCEYCQAPESLFNFPFEVEHVVPRSRDGGDDEGNLALACRACNLAKSDQLTGEFSDGTEPERLFDPRREKWEEHFRIDLETGVVSGLTRIGQGTIARLKINAASQLDARRQSIQLGLYP